jgi:DNA repair photolyase
VEADDHKVRGRGAHIRPANRYEKIHVERDAAATAFERGELAAYDVETRRLLDPPLLDPPCESRLDTEFLPDHSQSILAENDSPDVGFRYSVNPYRGCEHGCAYCYARPTHEWLGFDAGLDFETKILVKHRAPELLRQALGQPRWKGEVIAFSGNTDCYQPAERRFELTRRCLQVALEAGQPIAIITKNALILRDLDLLGAMAARGLMHVNLSITTLSAELARGMEPRASSPPARLAAVSKLTAANVPVRVLVAPVVPGLNDQELPAILKAAHEAGARAAGYVLLRLPLSVEGVFRDWLRKNYPLKVERIEALIKQTRGGGYYKANWGERMRGSGHYAEQIGRTFHVFARRYRLAGPLEPPLDSSQFRHPRPSDGQRELF